MQTAVTSTLYIGREKFQGQRLGKVRTQVAAEQ